MLDLLFGAYNRVSALCDSVSHKKYTHNMRVRERQHEEGGQGHEGEGWAKYGGQKRCVRGEERRHPTNI